MLGVTVQYVRKILLSAPTHFPKEVKDQEFWTRDVTVIKDNGERVVLTLFGLTADSMLFPHEISQVVTHPPAADNGLTGLGTALVAEGKPIPF